MSLTSWVGHSNKPKEPSTYPNSDGHSDGSIQTASPYIGPVTNGTSIITVNASAHSNQLFLVNGIPGFNGNPAFIYP